MIDPNGIWENTNTSYSGNDCTVIVQRDSDLVVLGNVTTFSYSVHRDKAPVRTLGRSAPKGLVSGGRTIAGSIVMTVFDRHPFMDIIELFSVTRSSYDRYTSPVPDQLPPLDIILLFNNEYGSSSIVKLYAVEFSDEGTTHSVNDIYSESVIQYVARDMDIMVSQDSIKRFKEMLFTRRGSGAFTDNYMISLMEYKARLEAQHSDMEERIAELDTNSGKRRSVGGLYNVSVGGIPSAMSGKGVVSEQEIDQIRTAYNKKLKGIQQEIDKVNDQINKHQKNIGSWNATAGAGGFAGVTHSKYQGIGQFDKLPRSPRP